MKHKTVRLATALVMACVAALVAGMLAGCNSQSSSSGSASSSASASASASAEQSQDVMIAELKDALANAPAFKSVTITEEEETVYQGDQESITATTIYKFDASGEVLKTSAEVDVAGIKLQYLTDGDNAVCVADGPIYSGTVEQFGLDYAAGFDAYLESEIGDLNTMIDCVASVEKLESNGLTFYLMTLDPEKYTASDSTLQLLAEYGSPVKEAFLTIGFEEDGSIASIDRAIVYEDLSAMKGLLISDYDNTTLGPLPEATKTFEEMEADIQAKIDAFIEESGGDEAPVNDEDFR